VPEVEGLARGSRSTSQKMAAAETLVHTSSFYRHDFRLLVRETPLRGFLLVQ
jgi:hypothetical protein